MQLGCILKMLLNDCYAGNQHELIGLYDPSYEHDSCGIGFVANINGTKSRSIVSDAITMLENMEHRGGQGR